MEYLIVVKALIAIAAVIGITIISEKKGPKLAGFLSALPIGTVITLFFLGFEISPQFAADSAVYNMAGLVGLEVLLLGYYLVSQRTSSMALAIVGGIICYALTVLFLRQIPFEAWQAAGLLAVSIPLFWYLFRNIPETTIAKKKTTSAPLLLFRAIVAASIIIIVTSIAHIVGPEWTGLFSGFPTVVLPVLIITHHTYEVKHVHTIIKHIPSGLITMVIYSLSVWHFYPTLGIYYGTFVAYGLVIAYLAAYWILTKGKK